MKAHQRSIQAHIRIPDGEPEGVIEADVLRYNVTDTYRTRFLPGCAAESLAERMPRIAWAHSWAEPIGLWTEILIDDHDRLRLRGKLDDFADVPTARRAFAQMRSGTIDSFSVGFMDTEARNADDGILDFVKIDVSEASPVLRGAVPGADLVSLRHQGLDLSRTAGGILVAVRSGGLVTEDLLISLARKVTSGEITQHEADAALELAASQVDDLDDSGQDDASTTTGEGDGTDDGTGASTGAEDADWMDQPEPW